MWDYSFAIPSILILAILLINYFMLQRLPIRVNKNFVSLLLIETIVITSDIFSSWACENYQDLPKFVVVSSNMIYFIFFILRAYTFFVFTCSILELDPTENQFRTFLCRLPMIITEVVTLSSPFTKAVFFIGSTGYQRGSLYNIIVLNFAIYLFFSIQATVTFKSRLKAKRDFFGILFYLLILIVGLIFRIMFPRYLLMDTFCVMTIISINLLFMNPEYFIERRTRLFNSEGLRIILQDTTRQKYNTIFAFVIRHYQEAIEIYGAKQMDVGIRLIGLYLRRILPKEKLFYYRSGRFVIMTKSSVDIPAVIKKIEERFKSPWLSDNVELYLEARFVEVSPDYEMYDSDIVINTLVNALNKANNSTDKSHILVGREMFDTIQNNTAIKRALEKAIENNKIEVFLQPIMDAQTNTLVGAESLCRIRDDKGEIISPNKFIPIAESNGRINQLGEQVFEKTCKFISENDMSALGLEWINVNLSAAQFMKKDLASDFSNLIEKYNLRPSDIHLEITEAVIVDDDIMNNQIQSLRQKGFLFSLDDYGTGYSNISRLKHSPFSNVKIDMSLVWDYCDNPNLLLPMLIKAFKKTGYSLTAEGIETKEIEDTMKSIGCDYLQGMYYSPPIPMDEFIKKYTKSS